MALWKESVGSKDAMKPVWAVEYPRRSEHMAYKESLVGADLKIEGKIEGTGRLRIAGRFKGDVNVDGDLAIDPGAHINGEVRAGVVVVGGEVQGNIQATTRVELLESGVVIGDIKAGSLTVAAGSRMRGRVEFGWGNGEVTDVSKGDGSAL